MSLYNISQELLTIQDIIEESQGEITEDTERAQELLSSELASKADGVVEYVKYQESRIKLIRERINEFRELLEKEQSKLDRFNEYVVNCMKMLNKNKIQGQMHNILIRKPSQVVNITNEDSIPPQYVKVETVIKIDKAQIKKDLKNGINIDGAQLDDSKTKAYFKL